MGTRGRPTKKTDEKLQIAIQMAELGLTDAQIAKCLGVERSTLSNWKVANPQFLDTLKNAKSIANEKVEKSLYKRALGYSYIEEKKEADKDGKIFRTTKVRKKITADTIACIFWLKNRKPEQWRDRVEPKDENEDDKIKIIVDIPETDGKNGH